ncbi:MAG: sugar phosphate isomerase/epimerase [Planctomycetaceae bacterium]|jgi:sugar phosphate isomerase/epimerase|nr:sugar phosphate isomerase/epimerase [Planctomycetaceae bacterium]
MKGLQMMLNRRNMLQSAAIAVGATAGFALTGTPRVFADDAELYSGGAPWADLLGWRLGCQAYSFNRFTFEEAVQKNASLGLRVIEGYPGQKLTKSVGAGLGPGLNKEQRLLAKEILVSHGVKIVNFGVTGAGRDTFDFAADMGIETICTEPNFKELENVSKLADEYQINVALHNHPKPTPYWDYKIVLEHIANLSPRVGACADTGHYLRSGLNPLEAIKALKGHIVSFHFKDLVNEEGKGWHDVPWGTGIVDIPVILAELKEQRFKGVFSIEYEYNWENSLPEIAKSVEYFNEQAKKMA